MTLLGIDLGLDGGDSVLWLDVDGEELLLQCFDCNLHSVCRVPCAQCAVWPVSKLTRNSDHLLERQCSEMVISDN